jgi:hypothetical protein
MRQPKDIKTPQERQEADQVLSLLEHKKAKGLMTSEDWADYRTLCEDVAVFDWSTESYVNHVPNMFAQFEFQQEQRRAAKKQRIIAKATLPETGEQKQAAAGGSGRPPLKRREGKYAV